MAIIKPEAVSVKYKKPENRPCLECGGIDAAMGADKYRVPGTPGGDGHSVPGASELHELLTSHRIVLNK
jgi:hypothetical protein